MYEKASRFDVLAKEFCRCPYCGRGVPHVSIVKVEPKTRGVVRKKHYYKIRAKCTHYKCYNRDFEVEVPAYQYWETLKRYGVSDE